MKLLITGGAGFIGMNVINNFIKSNEITTIDNLSTGYRKNIHHDCKFIKGDCSDDHLINNLNDNYDVIIHIAGQSGGEGSFDDTIYDLNANAKSTLLLLNLALRNNCKRFIFISTVAVYGGLTGNGKYSEIDRLNPNTFYAINKLTSEHYLRLYNKHYGINTTAFRLFNCYGPGQNLYNMKQGMVSIYLRQFLDSKFDKVLIKGSLERFRDFVFVNDLVKIIWDSIDNKKFYNEIINVGTGIKTTVGELVNNIKKIGGFNKEIIVKGNTPGDMYGVYADNKKLMKIYNNNFIFTKLQQGLKEMIDTIEFQD